MEFKESVDGYWNTNEYIYKGWKIMTKSRINKGFKAHAFQPNSDKVEFTLRYLFIKPDRLIHKMKNKIDKIEASKLINEVVTI